MWKKVLGSLAGILVVLAVVLYFFGGRIALYLVIDRHVDVDTLAVPGATQVELVTEDGLHLDAWDFSADQPRGSVVIISGLAGPSVTYLQEMGRMLQNAGYAALLVELRGVAGSDDSPTGAQEGGTGEVRDVLAGIDYLKQKYPGAPVGAWGTSMGGHTVLATLAHSPDLKAVVAASAFTSFGDMAELTVKGARDPVNQMMEDRYGRFAETTALEAISATTVPVLLAWSREDSQVPPRMSEELAKAYPEAETFVVDGDEHFIIPTTDDGFAEPLHQHAYGKAVLDFFDRAFA